MTKSWESTNMKQIWLSSPLPMLMLVILSWLIILFLQGGFAVGLVGYLSVLCGQWGIFLLSISESYQEIACSPPILRIFHFQWSCAASPFSLIFTYVL